MHFSVPITRRASSVPDPSPSRLDTNRYFFLIVGSLLAVMAAAQIGAAIEESPTNDEPIHLMAGYVYLTTGDYGMDVSHPPLGRLLAALPLLPLPLKPIPAARAWIDLKVLLWGNPVPADTILLRARLVTIALTMILGAWLAWWTRRRFDSRVALLALTFFAFDPNLIAHGHYVTTDMIATLGIFLTCNLWTDFLETPTWTRLALSAAALGLSLASKYSTLYLFLVLLILYIVACWNNRNSSNSNSSNPEPSNPKPGHRNSPFFTVRGAFMTFLLLTAGAFLIVALVYAPAIKHFLASPRGTSWATFSYFKGLRDLFRIHTEGLSYLLGHVRKGRFWEYFPVAFLVKTPTGVLLACAIALLSLWRARRQPMPVFLLLCLALPPSIFFLLAMRGPLNIGVRHILPIYPFLYILLAFLLLEYGRLVLRRVYKWGIAALIVLVAAESISIYPHDLAFFNWACGGPVHGPYYLLDSNIDWGQDLKNLSTYVNAHHMTPLCISLFGMTPAAYYGISARDLNQPGISESVDHLNCVVAVSVNFLHGLYIPSVVFAPLRQRQPVARIGYSIYLYDLRH